MVPIRPASQLMLILLASALGASPSHASEPEGLYVSAALGRSDLSGFDRQLPDSRFKTNEMAFKIAAGFQFNPNVGLEAGYVHFNDVEDRGRGGSPAFVERASARSRYLAVTGSFAVSDSFSLQCKLGAAYGSVSTRGFRVSESGSEPLWGVGAQYWLSERFALMLDYEDFGDVAEDVSLRAATFGLRVQF
jgi:hypothetical protein